ncbi:single-stranded DNA-binding protein, partial [Cronobacter sakazakii]
MTEKLVYQAISAVAKEMAATGISKDRTNTQQNFKFRGIDQVYNALAPALVNHGLLILPRITERTVTERVTQKGGVLFYVVVKAEFDFVSTKDGSVHTVVTYGEAMDSGDKATNKAMSIAYKYAAFQAFCIPTEETAIDADAEVHHIQPADADTILAEFTQYAGAENDAKKLQEQY